MSHKNCPSRLKNRTLFFVIITLLFITTFGYLLSDTVNAQTADKISLQGKIVRNDTGYEGLNVVNGTPSCVASGSDTCDFQVKYYDASTSGNLLYTEEFENVEIGEYGGVFNLSLGSVTGSGTYSDITDLLSNEDTVYLQIEFAPTGDGATYSEVFTRTQLNASAYAIRSKVSEGSIDDSFKFFNSASSSGITTTTGSVYYDTTDGMLKVYNGSGWQAVSDNLWTDGGTYSYLTSTTDDLILGGSTPGTSKFFFDVSEGRLGIGTDTPGASIDIAGASSTISNDTGDITISPAGDLIVDQGNVGIGKSAPEAKLHILAASTTEKGLIIQSSDDNNSNNLFEAQQSDGSSFVIINAANGFYANTASTQSTTFGYMAARNSGTSAYSVYVGYRAGYLAGDADYITAIGTDAGYNSKKDNMTVVGYWAGRSEGGVTAGDNTTAFGYKAAHNNTGDDILAVGYLAGENNTGSDSVFLGPSQGYGNTTANRLMIGNNSTISLLDGIMTDSANTSWLNINGSLGIGATSPTAYLHLKAGTASAGTAPLKFTTGTNLTTAESGAMEWDGSRLYITDTTPTRNTIAYTSDLTFTGLSDTPSAYTGSGSYLVRVNSGATGLEFVEATAFTDTDAKVGVDSGATPDYIGASSSTGVLRTSSPLSYSDGGNFITLGITANAIGDTQLAYDTGQHLTTTSAPTFATLNTGSGAKELGDASITNDDTDSIPTNDQVYDFVIGLGYSTTDGTVTSVGTGTGLTGGPITTTGTISFDYSNTLASNSLTANTTLFGSTGILFEGSTANTYETLLTVTDPTADRTITIPNASGTVVLGTGTTSQLAYWTDSNTLGSLDYSGWDTNSSDDVTTFVGLTDTPSAYTGSGSYLVRVNSGATGLEFVEASGFIDTDVKVSIDAAATADYIGADGSTGVLRTSSALSYADGGNYITLGVAGVLEDLDALGAATTADQFIVSTAAGVFAYESGSTVRTSLGATTVGGNLFTLTNPSAITFLRVNADNTVSALSASDFRTAIGAGTGSVSSVSNSDGTLTISPTTGNVVASLNLGNTNTWTASQTFNASTYFPGNGVWDSNGNVGIGDASLTADEKFKIYMNSATNYVLIKNENATSDASAIFEIDSNSSLSNAFRVQRNGYVGISDGTPASLFTVGSGDLFQVDSNGDIVKIKNVTYSWPSSQGGSSTVLTNNGSGTLTWSSVPGDDWGSDTVQSDIPLTGSGTSGSPLDFNYSATLASNPAMAAGETIFGSTGILFEGSTANTYETLLTVTDPTADRTITIPNATGTVALTSDIPAGATYWTRSGTDLYPTTSGDSVIPNGTANLGASGTRWNYVYGTYGNFSTSATTPLIVGSSSLALRPSSNSTTAIQLQNASGTNILNVDTTNSMVGIGDTSPGANLEIQNSTGVPSFLIGTTSTGVDFDIVSAFGDSNVFSITNDYVNDIFSISALGVIIQKDGSGDTQNVLTGGGSSYITNSLGIGDTSPASLLTVGSGDLFQVNSSGDIVKIKNVTYSWPGSNGSGVLSNNGSGTLSWSDISASLLPTGTEGQMLYSNAGTWTAFSGMYWDDSNSRLGIGLTNPSQALELVGSLELEDTTSSTTGVVYKDGARFIHNFQHPTGGSAVPIGRNIFAGENAGNFTMGSTASSTVHGSYNVGIGYNVLSATTTGHENAVIGAEALQSNTTGYDNVAVGYRAMRNNTEGSLNTATGYNSLSGNLTGVQNSAFGVGALGASTGHYNTAVGYSALSKISSGSYNIAMGREAGEEISGGSDNTSSSYSIFLGSESKALTVGGQNEIVIGSTATGLGSNTAVLGNDSITKTALKGSVGIGTTSPGAKLDIEGTSDAVQLEVKGYSTQTTNPNILQIKKSDDSILLSLANTGLLTLAGNFEGGTNNSYDIGSTSTRWKDIYTQGTLEIGANSDSGSIRYNTTNDELEFSNDGSNWIPLGDLTVTEVLSAEYAGAVMSADGTNNTGSMTSDALNVADYMNYYEWNSSETGLQDYDVRVRYTIPSDFESWSTNAFTLNFATEANSSTNNKVDIYVYLENGGSVDDSSTNQYSSSAGVWTTTNIQGADLGDCNAAGETCILLIRMYSANDNYVRIGDIDVNYNRKL